MGLLNVLTSIAVPVYAEGFGNAVISHKWIYDFISWLVSFTGDLGVGIILFTLALKLVTLPLDIISRASMKKNSLKMELMKDDLEKLQKQYANNKELYQQKMMALYKKNGYSAFSACLPTIITLVFFFIVLAGFQSFSRYVNKEVFNEMGKAYTLEVEKIAESGTLFKEENSGTYYVDVNAVLKEKGYEDLFDGYSEGKEKELENYSFKDISVLSEDFINEYSLTAYFVSGDYNYDDAELQSNVNEKVQNALVEKSGADTAKLKSAGIISEKNGKFVINDFNAFYLSAESTRKYFKNIAADGEEEKYAIDFKKYLADDEEMGEEFKSLANKTVAKAALEGITEKYKKESVKTPARKAAKEAYYEYRSHSVLTPWINNLWVVDSPFSKAVPTYSEFMTQMQKKSENVGTLDEEAYNEITYELGELKTTGFGKGNGLFILVLISILAMLGSTVISQKMQKTQMQLSTVDGANGTAASSQKMMTWMMPMMFGIFAFMYSAAFSLYMITSTLLSTGSTMLINFFVERGFKKKIEKEENEKQMTRKYGKRR